MYTPYNGHITSTTNSKLLITLWRSARACVLRQRHRPARRNHRETWKHRRWDRGWLAAPDTRHSHAVVEVHRRLADLAAGQRCLPLGSYSTQHHASCCKDNDEKSVWKPKIQTSVTSKRLNNKIYFHRLLRRWQSPLSCKLSSKCYCAKFCSKMRSPITVNLVQFEKFQILKIQRGRWPAIFHWIIFWLRSNFTQWSRLGL